MKRPIPEMKPLSRKLIYLCLALILIYLAFIVAYTEFSPKPPMLSTTMQMLQSAFLSAVIALGGGILLDFEIRKSENS